MFLYTGAWPVRTHWTNLGVCLSKGTVRVFALNKQCMSLVRKLVRTRVAEKTA